MENDDRHKLKNPLRSAHLWIFISILAVFTILFFAFPKFFGSAVSYDSSISTLPAPKTPSLIQRIFSPSTPPLDAALYDKKLLELANNPPPKPPTTKTVKDPKTGAVTTVTVPPAPVVNLWPVKAAYPNAGAILPFKRIIAYYGNLYSTKMGVLGQYPEAEMLQRLDAEVKKWEAADPGTPVQPALHYIAVVAQGSAGADGKYRFRMPDSEINKVIAMAAKINAIVFLDIQVGLSTVEKEIPYFEKYLKLPQVHLGLDPEFSMKTGVRPGKVVGTMDAADVNFASAYLAKLVRDNNLPPKVLIVHRYTQGMLTHYKEIKTMPEVQMVIHMDGWGGAAKKKNTYQQFVYKEPVQFTGFKLFYKNDILTKGTTLMKPEDLLKLNPRPIYVQYQ